MRTLFEIFTEVVRIITFQQPSRAMPHDCRSRQLLDGSARLADSLCTGV